MDFIITTERKHVLNVDLLNRKAYRKEVFTKLETRNCVASIRRSTLKLFCLRAESVRDKKEHVLTSKMRQKAGFGREEIASVTRIVITLL